MGENLKIMREKRELSQAELSKIAHVSIRTIQHYEQGTSNIDGAQIKTLAKLANVLQCGITDILDDPELIERLKVTRL